LEINQESPSIRFDLNLQIDPDLNDRDESEVITFRESKIDYDTDIRRTDRIENNRSEAGIYKTL